MLKKSLLRKFLRAEKIQPRLFVEPRHKPGTADLGNAGVQRRTDRVSAGYQMSAEQLCLFITKSPMQVKGNLSFFSLENNPRKTQNLYRSGNCFRRAATPNFSRP